MHSSFTYRNYCNITKVTEISCRRYFRKIIVIIFYKIRMFSPTSNPFFYERFL